MVCMSVLFSLPTRHSQYQGHTKRSEAAMAEAEKMGMKIVEAFWTMARTTWCVARRANDETMTAFALKIVQWKRQDHTMRAFRGKRWKAFSRKSNNRREASCTAAAREWSDGSRAT